MVRMIDCIREQGMVLAGAVEGWKDLCAPFSEAFGEGISSVDLIGSGTSWNASYAAVPFMERMLGIPVHLFLSSRYVSSHPSSLAFFISQSGASTNTIAAADRCSCRSFSVTADSSSPLCSHTDGHILMPAGEESVGARTKGYTATVAILYLLALSAARAMGRISEGECRHILSELSAQASITERNILVSERWVEENAAALDSPSVRYVVGQGIDYPIAAEGALKMMETILMPAAAFEAEEYLHGAFCSVSESVGGFYLLPEAGCPERGRIERIASMHSRSSGSVFTISSGNPSYDGHHLTLDTQGKEYLHPFAFILPLQVISACIPGISGDADEGARRFRRIASELGTKV